MRIPINWLEDYVKLPPKISVLTHELTMAGHMLDKIDKVDSNLVIDLELRGNRADCYSIMGIAREVSALFSTPVKTPPTYENVKKTKQLKNIKLSVSSEYLQRVMMIPIKNVKISKSPKWLKESLEQYGISSLNNIVDLSNFVMLETGQPLHTFDLDMLGNELSIRLAQKNENMTTFLGEKINLTKDDLVWANKDSVLSIAGAIGGRKHSISEKTINVLLEGASYNQANIRRTVHRHNLLTDAGVRHEKELDPNLVEFGILRFLHLIEKNNWGEINKEVLDYYPNPVKPWKIELNFDYLKRLSGFDIDTEVAKEILKRLNFIIIKENSNKVGVICPTYRTDVKLAEDLIEEILRIYGYDNIPENILSLEIPKNITPSFIKQENDIRNSLVQLGFDEVISIPFVATDFQKYNASLNEKTSPVTLVNRPSPEIEEMRMTMYPNLLNFVNKIANERGEEARIFEVGKIYSKKDSKYIEKRVVGIAYWKKYKTSYKKFKGYLEALFKLLQLKEVQFTPYEFFSLKKGFQIVIKDKVVGNGGVVNNIFFTEIYLDEISEKEKNTTIELWPKYPPQIEDLTLVLPEKTRIGNVIHSIKEADDYISTVELTDIYKNAYTFRIIYQDPKKTLTNEDVEKIRQNILKSVEKKYGALQKS